jgi:hypothetical protein
MHTHTLQGAQQNVDQISEGQLYYIKKYYIKIGPIFNRREPMTKNREKSSYIATEWNCF